MIEFLTVNCWTLIMVIAVLEIIFVGLFAVDYKKTKRPMALCAAILTFGLFYDAFMIDMGNVMGAGGLLETLSQFRFVSHGMLIPLLFPICAYALKAKEKTVKIVWGVTAVLMVAGLAEALATDLEIISLSEAFANKGLSVNVGGDLIRYQSSELTPGWAEGISLALSFGTVIPLIICGVAVWVKQKNPCIFLSGLLMFMFAGAGPSMAGGVLTFFITMFGELFMVGFIYAYLKTDKKELI